MADSPFNTEDKAGDHHVNHADLFRARYYSLPVGLQWLLRVLTPLRYYLVGPFASRTWRT
jgi:hypothetical protein